MPKRQTDEVRDQIIQLHKLGMKGPGIARLLKGHSESFANRTIRAYHLAEDGNIPELNRAIARSGEVTVRWACARTGLDFGSVQCYVPPAEPQKPESAPAVNDRPERVPPTSTAALDAEPPDPNGEPLEAPTAKEAPEADMTAVLELVSDLCKTQDLIRTMVHAGLTGLCTRLDRLATIIQSCSEGEIKKMDQLREESNANWDDLHTMVKDQATNQDLIKKNTRPTKAPNSKTQ